MFLIRHNLNFNALCVYIRTGFYLKINFTFTNYPQLSLFFGISYVLHMARFLQQSHKKKLEITYTRMHVK